MKFTDRKEWTYDPEIFRRADTQTALGIYAEAVARHSPRPYPVFYEVDRQAGASDALWHVSLSERTAFSREIEMPVLIKEERPDWRLTKVGLVPHQKYKVIMANRWLEKMNWFPMRGDFMYYNGYRNMIVNVVLEPEAYWQQTGVWMGLLCETVITADGDAKPLINPGLPLAPAEQSPGGTTAVTASTFGQPPIQPLPEPDI